MKPYREMSKEELASLKEQLEAVYKEYQGKNLSLNMARGKPCKEQLDLSLPMMDVLNSSSDYISADGDVRNYGILTGIQEAKELMGAMMDAPAENIVMYGNASLTLMFDTVSRAWTHGVCGSTPWCKLDKVKFLCPVPGYDRHFAITQYFGIEMINIPMTADGPDMDLVEKYVNNDETVKGIWCVPLYSNPSGQSYSDETVKRFANLKPAAKDFRIIWDNAYCVHHLHPDHPDHILDILSECAKAIVAKCKDAGVVMTGAGATYPYGKDPHDSNIRIAPSFPTLEDLKLAAEIFCVCVKLVSIDKLLAE